MSFVSCYEREPVILMEGALGERLKREFGLIPDENVALADIIYRPGGEEALLKLWSQYINAARENTLPFIATTPTRRANRERIAKAGYDKGIIMDNVAVLRNLSLTAETEMYIGGLMGCKGDAYCGTDSLSQAEAREFHSWQADLFAGAGADFLYAGIMPALPEAEGMAMAMAQTGLPYIISFMLRDNGRLLDGTSINDAIEAIDAITDKKPVCYMTNCIHPDVLYKALARDFNRTNAVKHRFRGIQANTSALPPEQLDNSAELKCSDSSELAKSILKLQ